MKLGIHILFIILIVSQAIIKFFCIQGFFFISVIFELGVTVFFLVVFNRNV